MSLKVNITLDSSVVLPGGELGVRVSWEDAQLNSELQMSVHWFTVGKGSTSECEVVRESWSAKEVNGQMAFRVPIPRGPLSCEGRLLSIRWEVRVSQRRGKPMNAELFDVGYQQGPIDLSRFPVAPAADKGPWIKQV